ncbi:MAG: O-antigen ligase family protein [Faecalibacterium prausnitzii]
MKKINVLKVPPRKTWLEWLLISTFLIFPDDLFQITGIYKVESPTYVPYRWLNYSFSLLFLIPVVIGGIQAIKSKRIAWLLLLVAILARSCVFKIENKNNIFDYGEYEIILTIMVACSLFEWFRNLLNKSNIRLDAFFVVFVVFHIITQFAQFALSLSRIEGRCNAINLDVETTGFLCGFTAIYLKTLKKYNTTVFLLCIAGLLLSGSRIALILTIGYLFFYELSQLKKKITIKNSTVIIMQMGVSAALVVVLLFPRVFDAILNSDFLSAITRTLNFTKGTDLGSYDGRTMSLMAGAEIVKEHPWGIDAFFTNIQESTVAHGYPTFPHSTMVSYYIMLGPLILIPLCLHFVYQVRKAMYKNSRQGEMLLLFKISFIVLFWITTGAPIVNYKIIYVYILALVMSLEIQN